MTIRGIPATGELAGHLRPTLTVAQNGGGPSSSGDARDGRDVARMPEKQTYALEGALQNRAEVGVRSV